jgi:NAD(P)H-hydrate epimerase
MKIRFTTENGIEVPAVTKEQMIEIDRIAIEETGPNLFQMMENAGRNLAELTIETLGENWKKQIIVIIAGTGGNGGGGICAARHLANRGATVKVCITDSIKLKEVPAYQLHILKSTNAKIISISELKNEKPDIILDAIIGYSLSGEPKGPSLELIQWTSQQHGIIISLDVPSGINSTTGEAADNHIKPNITLTLALPKTGLLPSVSGDVFLADIGIPQKVYEKLGIIYNQPFDKQYYTKLNCKV